MFGGASGGGFHDSILSMIWNASFIVQFVLLLLFTFSVISWTIIIIKYRIIKSAAQENKSFADTYLRNNSFPTIHYHACAFTLSPLAAVFRSAYEEMNKLSASTAENAATFFGKQKMDNIARALNMACERETAKLENSLTFLSTTASACPFIGLFGTVWGIMDTFRAIGQRGSATLAVVAPGISEALIATAIGLMAAIPAAIFYNYFINVTKSMRAEMNNFSDELLNILERNQKE